MNQGLKYNIIKFICCDNEFKTYVYMLNKGSAINKAEIIKKFNFTERQMNGILIGLMKKNLINKKSVLLCRSFSINTDLLNSNIIEFLNAINIYI